MSDTKDTTMGAPTHYCQSDECSSDMAIMGCPNCFRPNPKQTTENRFDAHVTIPAGYRITGWTPIMPDAKDTTLSQTAISTLDYNRVRVLCERMLGHPPFPPLVVALAELMAATRQEEANRFLPFRKWLEGEIAFLEGIDRTQLGDQSMATLRQVLREFLP